MPERPSLDDLIALGLNANRVLFLREQVRRGWLREQIYGYVEDEERWTWLSEPQRDAVDLKG